MSDRVTSSELTAMRHDLAEGIGVETGALLSALHELDTLRELTGAVRALLKSLPRCDLCRSPATHAYQRGRERYCPTHAPPGCPAYPRYAALAQVDRLLCQLDRR